MESGAFHGFPQVPLLHIVTSRVLRLFRKDTNQNAQEQTFGCQNVPAMFTYWSTKRTAGRGWSLNIFMYPKQQKMV